MSHAGGACCVAVQTMDNPFPVGYGTPYKHASCMHRRPPVGFMSFAISMPHWQVQNPWGFSQLYLHGEVLRLGGCPV